MADFDPFTERAAKDASYRALQLWGFLRDHRAPERLERRAQGLWEAIHEWWLEEQKTKQGEDKV